MQATIQSRILSSNLLYRTIILPGVLYRCETWSHTLREKYRLWVSKNRAQNKISGPKNKEVTGAILRICKSTEYSDGQLLISKHFCYPLCQTISLQHHIFPTKCTGSWEITKLLLYMFDVHCALSSSTQCALPHSAHQATDNRHSIHIRIKHVYK